MRNAIIKLIGKAIVKDAANASENITKSWRPTNLHTPFHIRQRLLDSAYQNITPLGYKGVSKLKASKGREILNTVTDAITGKGLNNEVPKWKVKLFKAVENNPELAKDFNYPEYGLNFKTFIDFRDEAWRLATNKNKYKGKLYKLNPNGTYSYDLDEVERIRAATGSAPFKGGNIILKGNTPENVGIPITRIANDPVTLNGGFVSVETIPERLISSNNQYYLGAPSYTIRDVWDLQPFKDKYRSLGGEKLHKLLSKSKRLKNFEVLSALGGNPFVLEQKIPAGTSNMWIQPLKMR